MISLQSFHTFQLDSSAESISKISSVEDCHRYINKRNGIDFVLLGEGSNSVFLEDYAGEVALIELFGRSIEETATTYIVNARAGEDWHEFVTWLLSQNINGLENLALIPGTVGACPIQNIGAYGVEVKQFVKEVCFFDTLEGKYTRLSNEECRFGYRNSIFKNELKHSAIICEVIFEFPKEWRPVTSYGDLAKLQSPSAKDIFRKVMEIRKSKLPDPKVLGNAGSFFKNPIVSEEFCNRLKSSYPNMPTFPFTAEQSKLAAGWLIDQSGLKGFSVGGAAVHDKQALVLVNESGMASSQGLIKLIAHIIAEVKQKFGVCLEPEVRLFGKYGELDWHDMER